MKFNVKKTIIILIAVAFVLGGCGQATSKQNKKTNNVENVFETEEISVDSSDFGNKQNPLYGKLDITDIPELKQLEYRGGSAINERFWIDYHRDENENIVFIFWGFVQRDENGKSIYKILDAINIGKLKENEYFLPCHCRLDRILDREIIAVVIREDKEYFDRIVRTWRADTKTGRIIPIEVEGIDCQNEGYGV